MPLQIDAGAVGPNDAVIGSHKTRLTLQHVEELGEMINKVDAYRDEVDELSDVRGKQLHGGYWWLAASTLNSGFAKNKI